MCNMDCFNCSLPDCTNNSLETREEKKMRTCTDGLRQKRYYYKNREQVLAKQKEYNKEHKAERREYQKKYYAEHREYIIQKESERIKRKRRADREWAKSENEKAKERYRRKKLETCNTD